jgi:hypothetical protein
MLRYRRDQVRAIEAANAAATAPAATTRPGPRA